MKVISLVTQKGGSGKSTLCVSLAVAAQEAGHSVCILEMDKQATASQWSQARSGQPPEVAQVNGGQARRCDRAAARRRRSISSSSTRQASIAPARMP